jgi:branched-chain amino acid transport system substrate-binding protein
VIGMLAQAINTAGTADDVVAVASALEGMEFDSMWGSKLFMRPQDHQLIQDMHIQAHTNEGVTFTYDNSDYGVVVESTVKMASMDSPTTCEMKRP